jgi:hypothetical protein
LKRGLIGGVVFGALYFVASQLAALAYLFLATAFGWHISGYHEPAEYTWWSLLLSIMWVAGFVLSVGWGATRSRLGQRPVLAAHRESGERP